MIIDPICGMQVNEQTTLRLVKDGTVYFFCSTHCRDKFAVAQRIEVPARTCCSRDSRTIFKNKLFLIVIVLALTLAASYVVPFLIPFRHGFLAYFIKIWWAVALGLLLGGFIDYYIPREYISKILSRKKPATIFNAVFLGFLMSACSHGILALSIQLHKKGASNPAVISFLLASPWANLTITVMLIGFFGLKGFFIIGSAIIVAITSGFIFMFLERKGLIEKNTNIVEVAEGFSIRQDLTRRFNAYRFSLSALKADITGVLGGARALSGMVLWWILLGMIIASTAGAYIPTHFFHKFMGPGLLGLLVTLALATVIEVCSEGSSPLAFEIYRQTGALGNSFIFLMAGVATDYTEIGLLWTNVGHRVALWLPLVTIPQIFLLGWLANLIFAH